MDHWIIKAEAERQDGTKGVLSCKFSERDSESTSDDECLFMLMMAAKKHNAKIIGPMTVVTDDSYDKEINNEQLV